MSNLIRPRTTCHSQRPSLTDDVDGNGTNSNQKRLLSRSFTFDNGEVKQQNRQQRQESPQPQQQPRLVKSSLPSPSIFQQKTRLSRSLLSNDNWREETMADVRVNSKVIEQSDRNILFGKGIDPLPHVREILNELSNTEAFLYARQCRVVVAKLRLCWIDVNEEIKSLLKHKEYTEASIEHIRKDLIINKESVSLRKKPRRESESDGVDDILAAEKHHLLHLKRILEFNCKNIVEQMQKLDEVRHRISKVGKERSVVTELICQCLTSASRAFEVARHEKAYKSQQFQRAATSCGFRSSQNNLNDSLTSPEATLLDENGFPIVGPLNAFTPDVIQVFQEAAKLIDESNEIKQQAMSQIKHAFNDAKAYSLTVNQSVAQKLADIITLAQHLTISLGENALAQNRAQRWYDLTMSAQRCNAGPISSSDYKIAERLDRPIMRTFQRHPGNQVPEAQIVAKTAADLQRAAEETKQQLKTVKIVGKRLQANLIDKERALGVDAHLLRRRREQSDHKWGVNKYVHV
ncbi:unnamed protein product [Adineta ricciae]|uniref:Uncharacterized protein n=1 Tax=Adineta ricciae TaxID=249248 RepID=A0A814U8F4_ADIRI|nr:unnamed protein product [Adineta ricciae]CAF1246483.1 unnamed protein product [Adineta ricciae]